jgi:hypothetical protein
MVLPLLSSLLDRLVRLVMLSAVSLLPGTPVQSLLLGASLSVSVLVSRKESSAEQAAGTNKTDSSRERHSAARTAALPAGDN